VERGFKLKERQGEAAAAGRDSLALAARDHRLEEVRAGHQAMLAPLQQVRVRVAAAAVTGLLEGLVLPVKQEDQRVKQLLLMEKQLLGRLETQLEFMEQYHERSAAY
jgi:hypothetical protein